MLGSIDNKESSLLFREPSFSAAVLEITFLWKKHSLKYIPHWLISYISRVLHHVQLLSQHVHTSGACADLKESGRKLGLERIWLSGACASVQTELRMAGEQRQTQCATKLFTCITVNEIQHWGLRENASAKHTGAHTLQSCNDEPKMHVGKQDVPTTNKHILPVNSSWEKTNRTCFYPNSVQNPYSNMKTRNT